MPIQRLERSCVYQMRAYEDAASSWQVELDQKQMKKLASLTTGQKRQLAYRFMLTLKQKFDEYQQQNLDKLVDNKQGNRSYGIFPPAWQKFATGTTGVFCIRLGGEIAFVFNVGDSAASLVNVNTGDSKIITEDHNLINPQERERVKQEGGVVIEENSTCYRSNDLNMGRCWGDMARLCIDNRVRHSQFSRATSNPGYSCDLACREITPDDFEEYTHLVVITDGISDAISDAEKYTQESRKLTSMRAKLEIQLTTLFQAPPPCQTFAQSICCRAKKIQNSMIKNESFQQFERVDTEYLKQESGWLDDKAAITLENGVLFNEVGVDVVADGHGNPQNGGNRSAQWLVANAGNILEQVILEQLDSSCIQEHAQLTQLKMPRGCYYDELTKQIIIPPKMSFLPADQEITRLIEWIFIQHTPTCSPHFNILHRLLELISQPSHQETQAWQAQKIRLMLQVSLWKNAAPSPREKTVLDGIEGYVIC